MTECGNSRPAPCRLPLTGRLAPLAGELGSPRFPDHRDPDLARVSKLILHLARDVTGDYLRADVIDCARLDHHPDLATRLHRVYLLHARLCLGDLLQPLQPLDVGLE